MTNHPKLGLFIAFEGGDGAGKSTQIALLAERLRAFVGPDALVVTREPGGTGVGAQIRQLVLHGEDIDGRTEALLFAADRAHHVATLIRPALAAGQVVLTDRYMDSSIAYQGARGLDTNWLRELSLDAARGLVPGLTVLLDVDPDTAIARREARGQADRIEAAGVDFHSRVRRIFLAQARKDPGRYLVLDAAGDPQDIAAQVWSRVLHLLAVRADA